MIIVGKKKFLKKDKSGYCHVLVCLVDFSDNQKENGCEGMAASDVFVNEKFYDSVKPTDFNKECVFDYDMNSFGKPEPSGIRFAGAK